MDAVVPNGAPPCHHDQAPFGTAERRQATGLPAPAITLDPGIAGWGARREPVVHVTTREAVLEMVGDVAPMNADPTSGDHLAEVNPGDPLYRDLQLRGYNRRSVGTPESVFVVDDTCQVVDAVDAVVASVRTLAVRSGGHCTEGLSTMPPSSA